MDSVLESNLEAAVRRAPKARRSSLANIFDKFRTKSKPDNDVISPVTPNFEYHVTNEGNFSKDSDFTSSLFRNNNNNSNNNNYNNIVASGLKVDRLRSVENDSGVWLSSNNLEGVSGTPMGSLLLSSSLSGAQFPRRVSGATRASVGPEDFLAMVNRQRAYSDCKDVRQAALKARQKKKSNPDGSRPVPTSQTDDMRPLEHIGLQRSQAVAHVGVSSSRLAIAEVIPEHRSATPVTLIPGTLPPSERRRRVSVYTAPPRPCGPGGTKGPFDPSFKVSPTKKSRRFSEPVRPNLSCIRGLDLPQLDVREAMNNFPKTSLEREGSNPPINKTGHVILWRSRGHDDKYYFIPDNPNCPELELDGSNSNLVQQLARLNRCYDIMPQKASTVILSSDLKVVSALDALSLHNLRSAPLWSSDGLNFIGMLTITDFINILLKIHTSKGSIEDIKTHRISLWRDMVEDGKRALVSIDADCSLHDAVSILRDEKIHRLLVTEGLEKTPLYILTYKRILNFINQFLQRIPFPKESFFHKSIEELKIGTYSNLATVNRSTKLYDALSLLVERRLSVLPVIGPDHHVIDCFSKAHVLSLTVNEFSGQSLNITVEDALKLDHVHYSFEGLYSCRETETLLEVINRITKLSVHRLVVLDDAGRLKGVVSLSDIMQFLVLHETNDSTDDDQWDQWDL